jgi:hypothetical protein
MFIKISVLLVHSPTSAWTNLADLLRPSMQTIRTSTWNCWLIIPGGGADASERRQLSTNICNLPSLLGLSTPKIVGTVCYLIA